MARYKDVLPNQTGWLHELAKAEIHPDAEKLLQLGRSLDPQQKVEESTIDFLTELREHFTDFARIFNGYSEGGTRYAEAKVYSVAQTAADFMIFRNQVKLVVSNTAHGMIQFSFSRHLGGGLSIDGQGQSAQEARAQELLAQVGPFRDVHWTFQGEKVDPEAVAKFYFAEFIRATRDSKKSTRSNQALLEQIKTLLHEKGLEL